MIRFRHARIVAARRFGDAAPGRRQEIRGFLAPGRFDGPPARLLPLGFFERLARAERSGGDLTPTATRNMLISSGLEQAEAELRPCLSTIALDAARSKQLRAQLHRAVELVRPAASPLEAQLLVREQARSIARDVFGDDLLARAREHLTAGGIIVWDGLPIEDRPAGAGEQTLTFGQALAAAIAQGTTQSFGFLQEDAGLHYQRLYPVAGLVDCGKTPDRILPHVDNAMLLPEAQPEAIHLVCVNNDAQSGTIFFTLGAVFQGLREGFADDVIDRLFEPVYVTAISNSFVLDPSAKAITTRPRPILYPNRESGQPTRFLGKGYDMGVQPGLDDAGEYERALAAFQHVLRDRQDLAYSITAQPGQAVSFHQQRMLHGRGPIIVGKYREMVRAYGRFDFTELESRLGRLPPHYIFDGIQLVDR